MNKLKLIIPRQEVIFEENDMELSEFKEYLKGKLWELQINHIFHEETSHNRSNKQEGDK